MIECSALAESRGGPGAGPRGGSPVAGSPVADERRPTAPTHDVEVDDGGASDSAEPLGRPPLAPPPALTAWLALAAGALLAARATRAAPAVPRGERVLLRAQPGRALRRLVPSLGLWELTRRTTHYAVTDRRVIVDRGLIRRTTRSIPLRGIVDVDVVTGPWRGVVRVGERRGAGRGWEELGPLSAVAARRLAETITRAIAGC